jgi:hypothetical protein
LSISGDTNNRVITADGDGTVTGEANLTFDGTTLNISDTAFIEGAEFSGSKFIAGGGTGNSGLIFPVLGPKPSIMVGTTTQNVLQIGAVHSDNAQHTAILLNKPTTGSVFRVDEYIDFGEDIENMSNNTVVGEVAFWGGGTVTQGEVYELEQLAPSSRTWDEAHADSTNDSTGMLAIALGSGTASEVGMLIRGYARFTSKFAITSVNAGSPVYLSAATEGLITGTAPSGTNDVVRIVGYVVSAENEIIYFNPDNTFVTVS